MRGAGSNVGPYRDRAVSRLVSPGGRRRALGFDQQLLTIPTRSRRPAALCFSRPAGAIHETVRYSWLFHDDGDEVAVCWIELLAPNAEDLAWIPIGLFVDRDHLLQPEEDPTSGLRRDFYS